VLGTAAVEDKNVLTTLLSNSKNKDILNLCKLIVGVYNTCIYHILRIISEQSHDPNPEG